MGSSSFLGIAAQGFAMKAPPTGTVTFLFTDIVGSSALWEVNAKEMAVAIIHHDSLLERIAADHCGYVFKRVGDGLCIAFDSAEAALSAAVAGQKALAAEEWSATGPIQVRMGLHSGTAEIRDGDYFGPNVNRAARIQGLAHGGQILLSRATKQLVAGSQLADVDWLDLGRHELAGLARPEQIFQVLAPGLHAEFPALKSLAVCPNNLPASPTPFVGRGMELEQLEYILATDRWQLVTIVGPGGMGKTRLALELARRQCQPRSMDGQAPALPYPDGVFFVPLSALESTSEVPPAIFQALSFQSSEYDPGGRSPWQQFLDTLGKSQMLLILDNFEQLVDGAGMVTELTAAAPQVTVVVTSRVQLSLRGEQLYPLKGMHYPEALPIIPSPIHTSRTLLDTYSALAMFVQSCERVNPSLEWTAEQLEQAILICRLLEGMPLAIELAAGWAEILTPAEIAAEIQRDLDFLQTDVKDMDSRHRSMSAVFEGTWQRLEPEDQQLFARLCVFRGGFTRAAAEQVARISLLQLQRLVRRSLLERDRDQKRYHIHRLLRQYGEGKLAGLPEADVEARDRHSAYFSRQMVRWGRELVGPGQLDFLDCFDMELANSQGALSWAVKRSNVALIHQGLNPLCEYYEWRMLRAQLENACGSAEQMLRRLATAESKRTLGLTLAWKGRFVDDDTDRRWLEESILLFDEAEAAGLDVRAERALAFTRLGMILARQDDAGSRSMLETALSLNKALANDRQTMRTLTALAFHATQWARYDDAGLYVNEWIALCRRSGDRRGLASSLFYLATIVAYLGEFDRAIALLNESATLSLEVYDAGLLVGTTNQLAFVLFWQGRFAESRAHYRRQLTLLHEMNLIVAEPVAMISFSLTLEGRYAEALEKVDELASRPELSAPDASHLAWARGTALLGLGRRRAALHWLRQSATFFENYSQLTVYSGINSFLLMARAGQGEIAPTVHLAYQAGSIMAYLMAMPAVALYFLAHGETLRAIEFYAAAARHSLVADSFWFAQLVGRHIAEAAAQLSEEVVAGAKARGAKRELAPTIAELAAEFDQDY